MPRSRHFPAARIGRLACGIVLACVSREVCLACDGPAGAVDVADAAQLVLDAGGGADPQDVASLEARLASGLSCLSDPPTPAQVAAIHLAEAVAAQVGGRNPSRDAALDAWVSLTPKAALPAALGADPVMVAAVEQARARFPGPVASLNARRGGWQEVDGRLASMHPEERPYLLQEFDGSGAVARTEYVWPDGLEPPPPPPPEIAENPGRGEDAQPRGRGKRK